MKMNTFKLLIFFSLFLVFPLFSLINIKISSASYAGDNFLITHAHQLINGDILYTLGNSSYSGQINPNQSYTVEFQINLPENSTVIEARLYNYWVWSKNNAIGVLPIVNMSFSSEPQTQNFIKLDANYTDTKGFVGYYDYYSGVYCYNVTKYVKQSGKYFATIINIAPDNRTFCIQGIGLLIIFQDDNYPLIEYWIKEGFDMLYAKYGITPEMATTTIYFEGSIDLRYVLKAELITIVPSGGYSWNPSEIPNRLFFNYEEPNLPTTIKILLELLFGDEFTQGKKWEDVYYSNQFVEIAIDKRDVTKYLKSNNNIAQIQDNQDYMTPSNAILKITYSDTPRTPENPILPYLPYTIIFIFGIIGAILNKKYKVFKIYNKFTIIFLLILYPFIIISNIYFYYYTLSFSTPPYFLIPPFSFNNLFSIIYLLVPILNLSLLILSKIQKKIENNIVKIKD